MLKTHWTKKNKDYKSALSKEFYQFVSLRILVMEPLSVLGPIEEIVSFCRKHSVDLKGQGIRALSDLLFKSHR